MSWIDRILPSISTGSTSAGKATVPEGRMETVSPL